MNMFFFCILLYSTVVVVVLVIVVVVVRPCFCPDSQKINSTALIINKTQALPAVRSVVNRYNGIAHDRKTE